MPEDLGGLNEVVRVVHEKPLGHRVPQEVRMDLHVDDRGVFVLGSSREGAVAININPTSARLILICPAWKKWGTAKTVKPGTQFLHFRAGDVVAFTDSVELLSKSGLPESALIDVGQDHRLADPEPLEALLRAVQAG